MDGGHHDHIRITAHDDIIQKSRGKKLSETECLEQSDYFKSLIRTATETGDA